MGDLTEGKIALRKATADEIEFLKARAVKEGKDLRKKFLPAFVFALCGCALFLAYNEISLHKPFYRILFSCVLVFGGIASSIYLYIAGNYSAKMIAKGEFKVQRGRIVDKKESDHSADIIRPDVVFESDDGIRSVIAVEKDNYSEITEGPCIILKWDYYGDEEVYEVAMLDKEE